MYNSDSPDDVTQIISKIMDEQFKSLHTNSSEFQVLLKEQKIEEIFVKSILPIFKVLKVLHQENKIDTDEFNQRTDSLMNILQLLEDVTENS